MEVRILSIKEAKEKFKNMNFDNVKLIISSSYDEDIETISSNDKLILKFDDICTQNKNSFNSNLAYKIVRFVDSIDFEKYQLYVCCDNGVSRSSAIAAAILRKYGENEYFIWKDSTYSPNILVYKILCKEFKLRNIPFSIKYKNFVSKNALHKSISVLRRANNYSTEIHKNGHSKLLQK